MTDFKSLKLRRTPNQYLVTPAGWGPERPNRESPVFARKAEDVYLASRAVALGEPRVQLLSEDPARRKLELVQRTRIIRFPDHISIEVAPLDSERCAVLVYSRSRFGLRDFGTNRRRIDHWLGLLAKKLGAAA